MVGAGVREFLEGTFRCCRSRRFGRLIHEILRLPEMYSVRRGIPHLSSVSTTVFVLHDVPPTYRGVLPAVLALEGVRRQTKPEEKHDSPITNAMSRGMGQGILSCVQEAVEGYRVGGETSKRGAHEKVRGNEGASQGVSCEEGVLCGRFTAHATVWCGR